jgi:hypothetical protein
MAAVGSAAGASAGAASAGASAAGPVAPGAQAARARKAVAAALLIRNWRRDKPDWECVLFIRLSPLVQNDRLEQQLVKHNDDYNDRI